MKIKDLLNEEVQSELATLRAMELGSEPYKVAVDGLTKLVDKAIELEKIEKDVQEKAKNRELEEKKIEADVQTKTQNRELELEKQKIDIQDKIEAREFEAKLRREQMKDSKIDSWIRNGIAIAGVIIPSVITVWGTFKTFKFEEEGTITTTMGRGFISKLIPKK